MHKLLIWGVLIMLNTAFAATQSAIFAGGCFWCVQADFDKLPGVISTSVGYDGGTIKDPTYELVSSGTSGYSEVTKVVFDPAKLSYAKLVEYFMHHIDPTNPNGQFCDNGPQYASKIFYLNDQQKEIANQVIDNTKKLLTNVYTQVLPSTTYYLAEDYHQDYYKKNPISYKFYRFNCGRDKQVKAVWNEK